MKKLNYFKEERYFAEGEKITLKLVYFRKCKLLKIEKIPLTYSFLILFNKVGKIGQTILKHFPIMLIYNCFNIRFFCLSVHA